LLKINVVSAATVLDLQRLADLISEYSQKYFGVLDPLYERKIVGFRNDFLEALGRLRQTASSEREQTETAKLREALDSYWLAFNRLKEQNKAWDPDDLPPDLTLAVNHLQAQAEVMLDAVQVAIKERVDGAAEVGAHAEQLSWIAGILALLVGSLVA